MAMREKKEKKHGYLSGVRSELKKVVYPSAKTVQKNTAIVIVLVLIVGVFIGLLDYALGNGQQALFTNVTFNFPTEEVPPDDGTTQDPLDGFDPGEVQLPDDLDLNEFPEVDMPASYDIDTGLPPEPPIPEIDEVTIPEDALIPPPVAGENPPEPPQGGEE
ncbi:MAG: preprotein translocase subunit SecE [Clostridiales bacterium]|jgi:preprotein translocase SecE subunit|nr:preprotein translocase subunit SecE [Clostridiales bacterium]